MLAIRILAAYFLAHPHSNYIFTINTYGSSLLIHDPHVYLIQIFGSCIQAGYKLTTRFSFLSHLSSNSAYNPLTPLYYTLLP